MNRQKYGALDILRDSSPSLLNIKFVEMFEYFSGVESAPLRSYDEFLGAKSRFESPDFNNPDKWFNRIINNLLYYQSNYFLSALAIFIIMTVLRPVDMSLGLIIMSLSEFQKYF